ncbi:MAG: hypothetical protein ACKVQS_00480 [Fimbriimonadaceae bacterium]
MFYLQRSGSPDQEGPYSFEYLKQIAREGRLNAEDLLIPVDGGESFRAGENLEFGNLPRAEKIHKPPITDPPPITANPNTKVSAGTTAVIVAVAIISLCCVPSFFLFKSGTNAITGEPTGVASIDSMTSLRQVTQATLNYTNDWDTFYPSGMDDPTRWQNQIRPYLEDNVKFEVDGHKIEANPNLARIRRGTIIDPTQTLMFFIRDPIFGGQSPVSNAEGAVGAVDTEKLARSIRRNIYNVPFR